MGCDGFGGGLHRGRRGGENLAIIEDNSDGLWKKVIVAVYGSNDSLDSSRPKALERTGSGGRWLWELEKDTKYSVASLRKEIDSSFLGVADVSTVWVRSIPGLGLGGGGVSLVKVVVATPWVDSLFVLASR
ncbi:hypothetical protein L1887_14496 [Cichorium endivia]|nr:hypothetical protein L1887_14496 [Cichorium endivia]